MRGCSKQRGVRNSCRGRELFCSLGLMVFVLLWQIPAGSSANVLGIEPQVVFIFVLVCGVHGEARRLQKERNNKIKIRTNDLIRKCTCSNTKHNWTNFFPATRLYLSFPRASLSARVSVEKKKEWTVYGETFTYTHFWFLNINFGIETWLYSRHRCYL